MVVASTVKKDSSSATDSDLSSAASPTPVESPAAALTDPNAARGLQVSYSRNRRSAVSAEPVSNEAMDSWTPPVFPKSDVERIFLLNCVGSPKLNLLFGHLSKESRDTVVDATQRREVQSGEMIIEQGEMGDYFYIVESGKFDIFVLRPTASTPEKVMEATRGSSFGELALLYNAPRAATCKAVEASVVWALDRLSFKLLLCNAENTKKKTYEGFLEDIDIFKPLNRYERSQLSDLLATESYPPGAKILSQGDTGDRFYIVANGECRCMMSSSDGSHGIGPELEVLRYRRGGFFGELALMCDSRRKASVYAVDNVTLLWIDKSTFDRVLGPIIDILRKHADSYPTYAQFLTQQVPA